ncbi:hypothetical protein HDU96_010177 [Phlyctochytrium bullatum]|nr:hypothetical protein HDU96_010177 [Phlyctochytrium bullatum]
MNTSSSLADRPPASRISHISIASTLSTLSDTSTADSNATLADFAATTTTTTTTPTTMPSKTSATSPPPPMKVDSLPSFAKTVVPADPSDAASPHHTPPASITPNAPTSHAILVAPTVARDMERPLTTTRLDPASRRPHPVAAPSATASAAALPVSHRPVVPSPSSPHLPAAAAVTRSANDNHPASSPFLPPAVPSATKAHSVPAPSASASMMTLPRELVERYRVTVEEKLGAGGFGSVFAAARRIDGLEVAVKVIPRAKIPSTSWAKDRDLGVVPMEVFILKNIRHPNVIGYRDFFKDDRCVYLVTDRFGASAAGKQRAASASPAVGAPPPVSRDPPTTTAASAPSSLHASPIPRPGNLAPTRPVPPIVTGASLLGSGVLPSPCSSPTTVGAPAAGPVAAGATAAAPVSPVSLASPVVPPKDEEEGEPKQPPKRTMDLFECIEKRDRLPEAQARFVFGQVAAAVRYLHGKNVVHRDIKDENVIIDADLNVRLIDFGSATVEPSTNPHHTHLGFRGTITYASPEILRGERYRGRPSDVWALGVLLYTILFGVVPFKSSEHAIHHPFKAAAGGEGGSVNPVAVGLIGWMLAKDPAKRPTAEEIMRHPWLRGGAGGQVGGGRGVRPPTAAGMGAVGATVGAAQPIPGRGGGESG